MSSPSHIQTLLPALACCAASGTPAPADIPFNQDAEFQAQSPRNAIKFTHEGKVGINLQVVSEQCAGHGGNQDQVPAVELMGGQLTVTSQEKRGSTFTFILPCKVPSKMEFSDGQDDESGISDHEVLADASTEEINGSFIFKPRTLGTLFSSGVSVARKKKVFGTNMFNPLHTPNGLRLEDDLYSSNDCISRDRALVEDVSSVSDNTCIYTCNGIKDPQRNVNSNVFDTANRNQEQEDNTNGYLLNTSNSSGTDDNRDEGCTSSGNSTMNNTKLNNGAESGNCNVPCHSQSQENGSLKILSTPNESSESDKTNLQPKILLVEDNKINIMVARSMMKQLGHQIDVVSNGLEAIHALQRSHFDLILMVCKIVPGQRYSKRLSKYQIKELLKVTCQRPNLRERDIVQTVGLNAYHEDPYAREFGINISSLASVDARILPPPWLKYHESGQERDCLPRVGQWNMMNKRMVNGGTVNNWTCINFAKNSKVDDNVAGHFCYWLASMCYTSGMDYAEHPVIPILESHPSQVDRALRSHHYNAMSVLQGKNLDLLVVILPEDNGSLYGDVKRICETDLGVVSQCCLSKHVFRQNNQYLANVALKINVKVGGRNTVLMDALSRRIPLVSDVPTIIFGADVTHPQPGEDSSPSIAAVVASQDWPEVTKYAGLVCAQAHRQELISDLYTERVDPVRGPLTGGMIKELLISFKRATNQKPQRIIFYRDGVSEGQFYQVLLHELDAIRKACASLEPNYQPPVTFIVVQKRHHTRLFANNHNDKRTVDRSGNIIPGTVVDSKICHPTEFDFYLCSHAGIQGTSRPAHYHVLWDDNNFTADTLQSLTNNLCYTYARCTRSVSIVPPAYYAHLAAFRARLYMSPDTSDGGSVASGAQGGRGGVQRSTRATGNTKVRELPELKDNVKRVMFYC